MLEVKRSSAMARKILLLWTHVSILRSSAVCCLEPLRRNAIQRRKGHRRPTFCRHNARVVVSSYSARAQCSRTRVFTAVTSRDLRPRSIAPFEPTRSVLLRSESSRRWHDARASLTAGSSYTCVAAIGDGGTTSTVRPLSSSIEK
eukprot:3008239-Rhodomonas_salina.2